MLYVKDNLHYKRRSDLEIIGIECIWIETHTLYKTYFVRRILSPPNTTSHQHSQITDSIHLAVDTGVSNIIITGDLNINMKNPLQAKKIDDWCQLFSLNQLYYRKYNSTLNILLRYLMLFLHQMQI